MSFNQQKVSDIIQAFSKGEIILVTDENDRENEADLIVAAIHCTPEKMAFIIRNTSGIVCTPMPHEEAKRLNLNLMIAENEAIHGTAFTVSVDFKYEITTGISAVDRALTVCNLANPNAKPSDFVRPEHIFPLIAREGGVLTRAGHTEAAVDLCKLAKLPPVAVICELVNDDGTVKQGDQVFDFAIKHGLKLISVVDLITWRQREENLIQLQSSCNIETSTGYAKANTYSMFGSKLQYTALIVGDISSNLDTPVPVHLYQENPNKDIFFKKRPMDHYVRKISAEGKGVIIYLRRFFSDIEVDKRNSLYNPEIHLEKERKSQNNAWQEAGIAAQILKNLHVNSIRLLDENTCHASYLRDFGIEVKNLKIS